MMRRTCLTVSAAIAAACAMTPPNPCGGTEPLGCSIPPAVLVASRDYEEQADKFHNACVTHDLCYRHGAATYGTTREECDDEFYENMKAACQGMAGLGVLDPADFAKCQVAALETYEAVREHGAKHFRAATSSYCDYR